MRYLKQTMVLRRHAFQLQEKYQILLQVKNKATAEDISQIDRELNDVQDELLNTNSAIDILGYNIKELRQLRRQRDGNIDNDN